jgi:7-cyano-7-deazaguanine synthase in queuosine biosynthesis
MTKKTLALLSGGLDSSVLLMKIKEERAVTAVFVDRGQSNRNAEQASARKVAAHANCNLDEIDVSKWWSPVKGKVEMIDVPRNPLFALLASPFAVIHQCREIAIGSTTDDAKTGDSNEGFVAAFNRMVDVMGMTKVPRIVAPFLELRWAKTDVAKWAHENLGDEFIAMTHSCWRGDDPCGACAACIGRKLALKDAAPDVR